MIKEEDLIIDVSHWGKDILGEVYCVEITHEPTGESAQYIGRSVHDARQRALAGLRAKLMLHDIPKDILDEVLKLKISPEAIENNLYPDDWPPNPPLPWNGKDASNG